MGAKTCMSACARQKNGKGWRGGGSAPHTSSADIYAYTKADIYAYIVILYFICTQEAGGIKY